MSELAHDPFLHYYNRELEYLRNAGRQFSKSHPKIARRLELGDSESPDPHVERLLESFAFLTAKISQEIDQRYPETASALLNSLYPHLVNPIPAMAIAHFKADAGRGKLTSGYNIPKGTSVFAAADEGVNCKFQTVYPLKLWPIEVASVNVVRRDSYQVNGLQKDQNWFLRLRLRAQNLDFRDIDLDEISFHLRGDYKLTTLLYEVLFCQLEPSVYFSSDHGTADALPAGSIAPMGFAADEVALPSSGSTLHSYQLLQEYFHLPEKFLFFKLQNLLSMKKIQTLETNELDILISVKDASHIYEMSLTPENFQLGCTPIINLFSKTTDPFRLDKRRVQYMLVPDQRLDRTTEIYSIKNVVGSIDGIPEPQPFSPYFAFDHHTALNPDAVYWVSKRISAANRSLPGADMYLSFVDLNFNPSMPPHQIIYAETLCTNRYLAEQLPYNTLLKSEEALPVHEIVCLDKPKAQTHAPADGETLWKMISQLSVNHLGVTSGKESVSAIRDLYG
jgi:type VI secretion system protein ImpG